MSEGASLRHRTDGHDSFDGTVMIIGVIVLLSFSRIGSIGDTMFARCFGVTAFGDVGFASSLHVSGLFGARTLPGVISTGKPRGSDALSGFSRAGRTVVAVKVDEASAGGASSIGVTGIWWLVSSSILSRRKDSSENPLVTCFG